ncbi:hypothetical protein ABS71_19695 [bacterium SCN 62-11]|nr:intradiol ring-cleavage dioxygenase [Candidatus Eremiobacteraeota bacterium]ODT57557.1 MAG: hypothetical protein ABS71_19695 [bacterium SCN 62-11]
MCQYHEGEEIPEHDRGLQHDLETMKRRSLLGLLVKAGMTLGLVGCGSSSAGSSSSSLSSGSSGTTTTSSTTTTSTSTTTTTSAAGGACSVIPSETGGPYPADGSNGPNALTMSGIVRSDIRPSFANYSGTAQGIPLTINLTLVNVNASCAALADYAIYLWHCDRDGLYSLYSIPTQNYLRGVQVTDSVGKVTFTSIFPACYSGRWPHIHFEVYRNLAAATSSANNLKTSQIALTSNACNQVYATSEYTTSRNNFTQVSLASDNVFSDGYSLEIAEITGDNTNGYVLNLEIGIAA